MQQLSIKLGLLLLVIASAPSFFLSAQRPAVDFSGVDPLLKVKPTEILTLGSTHLSAYRDSLQSDDIASLRKRLVAYKPDVITIESVPGTTCELLLKYPAHYANAGDNYCKDPASFREESNLTMDSALTRIRQLLGSWQDSPTSAQRRQLSAAFLAANNRYSALVQWFQLQESERSALDGLGDASVAYLNKLSGSMNENVQLGAMVAAKLGHTRIFPVDDHSADELYASVGEDFWSTLGETWNLPPSQAQAALFSKYEALEAGVYEEEGLLKMYRAMNTVELQQWFLSMDFQRQMNDLSEVGYGRRYVAWWQTRNLRMVSSIVAAAANAPGGKVLCIVGASHKPYYDGYLNQMHDIKLGDSESLLR